MFVKFSREGGERERDGIGQRVDEVLGQKGRQAAESVNERLADGYLIHLNRRYDFDNVHQRVIQRGVVQIGKLFHARRVGLFVVASQRRHGLIEYEAERVGRVDQAQQRRRLDLVGVEAGRI